MKRVINRAGGVWFCIALLVAAACVVQPARSSTPSAASTADAGASASLDVTQVQVPTTGPSPARSPTPQVPSLTPQPTPSMTPSASATYALPATLAPAEAADYAEDLAQTNGGCLLPCLLGIHPGRTSVQSALEILGPAGWQAASSTGILTFGSDGYPNMDFAMSVDQANVLQTFFLETAEYVSSFPAWAVALRRYWIDAVLHDMGTPSEVYVAFGGPGLYYLFVVYEPQGFMARYNLDGPRQQQDHWEVCAEYEGVWALGLYSQAPDTESSILVEAAGHIDVLGWVADRAALPWEAATGLDLSDFEALFADDDNVSCFSSPFSAWPW